MQQIDSSSQAAMRARLAHSLDGELYPRWYRSEDPCGSPRAVHRSRVPASGSFAVTRRIIVPLEIGTPVA
jgi:hypothetical protein